MFKWLLKIFNKTYFEKKRNYHVIISKEDAQELEYYWESLYAVPNKKSIPNKKSMEFRKNLLPSKIQIGYIFNSDSGIPFKITNIMADGLTIKAKRYSNES